MSGCECASVIGTCDACRAEWKGDEEIDDLRRRVENLEAAVAALRTDSAPAKAGAK